MADKHAVKVGRPYDPRKRGDGLRVLVDRIWPRGLTKERADLDEWCKQIAPSTGLRKWYGHDPERFEEAEKRNLTLLTASKRVDISEAVVLAEVLRR